MFCKACRLSGVFATIGRKVVHFILKNAFSFRFAFAPE